MSNNHQLSDSGSPAELATHARIVEAARKPFSVLAINSGSSSLRFTLFKAGESLAPILTGKFERIGLPDAGLSLTDVRANQSNERRIDAPNHVACVSQLVELLEQKAGDSAVGAIGYRVVHGGPRYREPQRVDEAMLEERRLRRSRTIPAAMFGLSCTCWESSGTPNWRFMKRWRRVTIPSHGPGIPGLENRRSTAPLKSSPKRPRSAARSNRVTYRRKVRG